MKKVISFLFAAALSFGAAYAAQLVPVFQETFSRCKSTVIQGGYFSESTYFEYDTADNEGWDSRNVYQSERAVKFSAKTKTGTATSPAISFSGDVAAKVVVRLRVQAWKNDNVDVHVRFDGIDQECVINSNDANTISDRSLEPYEITFSNIPTGSKLSFSATARDEKVTRFFLSDIVVFEEVESSADAVLVPSAFYHHFDDIMIGDESEERTVSFLCAGFDGPVEAESTENFTVGAIRDNVLPIRFTPRNAGSKDDVLVVRGGGKEQKIILTGNAKVYAPVVAEASDITSGSFRACWEPAAGMDKLVLTVYTKENGPLVAPDLMFTKYIEGQSNNRALEIFNGTGKDVSLKGYSLKMESNGAGGLTYAPYDLPDMTLAPGKTFTLCNAQCSGLRDIADKTIGFQDGGYANITTFTGDDAIGLFNPAGELVDLLGYESYDVNPRVDGNWGTDVSYYRKPDCYMPHDKFYVEEWEKHEKDYMEDYGTHTMDAEGPVRKIVEQVELPGDATSYDVKNLASGTHYYYAVQGYSNGFKTPSSKESEAVTETGTGIDNVAVSVLKDNAVYNLSGVRVAENTGAISGLPAGIYVSGGRKLVIK